MRPEARSQAQEAVLSACLSSRDLQHLRVSVLDLLRIHVGFDSFVWVATDPTTTVGVAPYADVPDLAGLPELIRAKYLSGVNRWTDLADGHAVCLPDPHGEDVWTSRLRALGVVDVASVVHRDRFGTWGFLDLWRGDGTEGFDDDDLGLLASLSDPMTNALRRHTANTFDRQEVVTVQPEGPVVLLLDDDLVVRSGTTHATTWLAALLPPTAGSSPVPAAVLNVAAQLLAVEAGVDDHPALARTHFGDGVWIIVRAERMDHGGGSRAAGISVTLSVCPSTQRLEVFVLAHGLSDREGELVRALARGLDTREVAEHLFVSPHTVQDHLKSVFEKTGVRSRRALLARALGAPA